VFHEDRANGFVLPMQDLRGMEEEVLAGDIVHGAASWFSHPFFAVPSRKNAGIGAAAGQRIRRLGRRKCREFQAGTRGSGQLTEARTHRLARREEEDGWKKR